MPPGFVTCNWLERILFNGCSGSVAVRIVKCCRIGERKGKERLVDDFDFDVYAFRDVDTHDLAECPFAFGDVDDALVDAHLPGLPRVLSFAVWRSQCWDCQYVCR